MELIEDREYLEVPGNEAKEIYKCESCGTAICEGYEYYELEEGRYCEDCIEKEFKVVAKAN